MTDEPAMTKADIDCYKINYSIEDWKKIRNLSDADGWIMLPVGILYAVKALCDEVCRLRGWKK